MNYFDYENQFWKEDEMQSFTPVETRTYFYLLTLANRSFWQGDIIISDAQLSAKVGVSLNSFKKAKANLQERGLISYVQGGKGYARKTRYQLRCRDRLPPSNPVSCQGATPLYSNKQKSETKTYYKSDGGSKKGFNTTAGDFD
ncbi:MAG: hypothetical protein SNI70_11945 [Rikenellaceae bacterium]